MATTTLIPDGGLEVGGTAPMSFTHGGGQVDSDVLLEWDLDNDGDFDAPEENVTGFLYALETQLGRDFPSQLNGRGAPGRLQATLRNDDDRFSYFNAASPLAQAPFSLGTGRKIRVRAATAPNPDPVLIDRDRFRRPDGSLGVTELGRSWSNELGAPFVVSGGLMTATLPGEEHLAVIDVDTTDYLLQARFATLGRLTTGLTGNLLDLVYRYHDNANYSAVRVDVQDGNVELVDIVAGAPVVLDTAGIEIVDDLTVAVAVSGTTVVGYVDGFRLLGPSTAALTVETMVGVHCTWHTGQPAPQFGDVYVWSGLPAQTEGVIWTGEIEKVNPDVQIGDKKVAEITAVGRMAKLATQDIPAPRFAVGQTVGIVIGHVLGQAGLLHPVGGPPAGETQIIDQGTVATGPIAFKQPEGKALDWIRQLEEHELGFFCETNEGYMRFDSRTARVGKAPAVTFSDAPGAQFGYFAISPADRERDIVNRVLAGVAPSLPVADNAFSTQGATGAGVQLPVTFTIPAGTGNGDLLVLIIAWAGGSGTGEQWLSPLWWVTERDVPSGSDQVRTRIYTHISDGTEVGTVYTFYADAGNAGGSVILYALRYPAGDWYGTHEGIHIAEFAPGSKPPVIIPPWGADATEYIAIRAGLSSTPGATVSGAIHPLGYTSGFSQFQNGAVNTRDVGLQVARRASVEPIEDPGPFGGTFGPFTTVESTVVAIRGWNGSPPAETVVQVQADDHASQDNHNAVRTHEQASNLNATSALAETYCESVLGLYAEDRPIFELTFVATLTAAYRAQAIRRRVSDRITLVAHHRTGMLSAPRDFSIEGVRHRWSHAGKRWEVTWDLSPA